ncbi:MAG: efflux RND transporter periplasmic adaptor subunit [Rhodothermales bacterium]|nr:efflux RND transporter periplasmic adaptor subunit [Rhodothermales bacterium]MBO6779999.1 efflux RND transporter periplasmic adaptor subunit [Rhodothermales bacterium]
MKEKLKSAALVVGILVAGFAVSGLLAALRADPPREVPPSRAPLVESRTIQAAQGYLEVTGTGTTRPRREIQLAAQVGGRITWVSPSLESGGTFSAGQTLARIESADYENAVAVAEAQVTQRQFEVLQAREEVAVARDEWQRASRRSDLGAEPDSTELGRLAFREPQLALAEAGLRAARAQLADARLRLERTNITTPFPGRVRAKTVDLGQFVAPGTPVASIYGTDQVEVVVQLTREQMNLIDPDWTVRGSIPAEVTASVGGREVQWPGFLDRIEGALDPATRQVNAVVRVPNPFQTAGRPPLFVGTFVQVGIRGIELPRFFDLPRGAVHEGGGTAEIWLLEDNTLRMVPVTVVQRREDRAVIQAQGLPDTFDLITTELLVVTDGMTVRTTDTGAQS